MNLSDHGGTKWHAWFHWLVLLRSALRGLVFVFLLEITIYSYIMLYLQPVQNLRMPSLLKKILPKESTPSMHRRKETMATNRNKLSNNAKC